MSLRLMLRQTYKALTEAMILLERSVLNFADVVRRWLDRTPPRQLATISLSLLIPTIIFWLSIFIYFIWHNSILLDLFFKSQLVGYLVIAGLPLTSGMLAYLSFRQKHTGSSRLGLTLSIVFLLFFLVAVVGLR